MGATFTGMKIWLMSEVSIHAPVMGATAACADVAKAATVSIHAPVMGATYEHCSQPRLA